jgi:hypothetical protein
MSSARTRPASSTTARSRGKPGPVGLRRRGFNLNWDATWKVRTRVSDIGWSAEMEIPFTSLRFGAAPVQTWGFNFERRIRRNNEVAYWAPMSQERNLFRVSEAGSIEGIRVPRQRNLQLTPYRSAVTRAAASSRRTRSDEEIGFDLKYSITSSLTLDRPTTPTSRRSRWTSSR